MGTAGKNVCLLSVCVDGEDGHGVTLSVLMVRVDMVLH